MKKYWCFLLLTAFACAQQTAKNSTFSDTSSIKQKSNMQKTYTGKAVNAKSGAVLQTSSGNYYMEGMEEWSNDLLDKNIMVEGIAEERKMISDPVNENGEIVQGAWGTQLVLTKHKVLGTNRVGR